MLPASRIATNRPSIQKLALLVTTAALLPLAACESTTEPAAPPIITEPLMVEFAGASDFTDATAEGQEVGRTELQRLEDGLSAVVHADGLVPGGVFTFWLVAVQDDGTFPTDIFVALGGSAVIGDDGLATVPIAATVGDPGIVGFPPLGGALFSELRDPANALVRIEVAYHGQAEDAGTDLDQWLADFWTGSACPDTGLNAADQPHCPVYFASTHMPPA